MIDGLTLTRDCLSLAFNTASPDLIVLPFTIAEECIRVTMESDQMRQFRTRLFTRIVPTVKDIGLWGSRVQKAYADMGVLDLADVDAETLLENDNRVALEFDAARR